MNCHPCYSVLCCTAIPASLQHFCDSNADGVGQGVVVLLVISAHTHALLEILAYCTV